MGQHRRTYTDEFKAGAVDRLYEPGVTQGSVAKELGITGTQLKTWRLEMKYKQQTSRCDDRLNPPWEPRSVWWIHPLGG